MKKIRLFNNGFGFIEIILVLAVILFLAYKVFNAYFKKTPFDQETSRAISAEGIDTTNYKTIVDSSRDKLHDIQKQRTQELEAISP